jgi:hypothetical protein
VHCPNCGHKMKSLAEIAKDNNLGINQLKHRMYRKGIDVVKAIALGNLHLGREGKKKL